MISIKSKLTVAGLATAVFFIALLFPMPSSGLPAPAAKKIQSPDFAYPKTVAKNSGAALKEALSHNDWPATVTATIQSVTADNIISRENVIAGIAKTDSLAAEAPDCWKPAFFLIKADIYKAIYNNIRWNADSRKIPVDSLPANPYDWSRDIFAQQTYDLCEAILANGSNGGRSLKEWKAFLENTRDAFAAEMTVDEFLAQQCVTLLNVFADASKDVIPFFAPSTEASTPGQKCTLLRDHSLDRLIDETSGRKQKLLLAKALSEKAATLPYSTRMTFLASAFERVKASEGEQLILADMRDFIADDDNGAMESANPISLKQYTDLVKRSVSSYPRGIYCNTLKNILNDLTQPSSNIKYQSQYLSTSPITMDVALKNCSATWILVYDYSPFVNAARAPKTKSILSRCRKVAAVKVSAGDKAAPGKDVTAEVGLLPVGTYVVVPSATPDARGVYRSILNESWREPFKVSDISVMTLQYPDATTRVFVVNGENGQPVKGAKVRIYTRRNYSSPRQLVKTLTTNKDGYVTVTEKQFDVEATYGISKWSSDARFYNTELKPDNSKKAYVKILADRAIFHPGDSIQAAIVAYGSEDDKYFMQPDRKIEIRLLDANNKQVASDTVTTDAFGRAATSFRIPAQGLLGDWRLAAFSEDGKNLGRTGFEVADYVAPTFFITAEKSDASVSLGDSIRIEGSVMTYSGMPVGNATVRYSVRYSPPMRWYVRSMATYDSSVSTDSDGKFSVTLPTERLKGTQFEKGIFNISFSATSPAGETQNGPTEKFALGDQLTVFPVTSDVRYEISDSLPELKFTVSDMLGRTVNRELAYRLTETVNGKTVAEGKFMSPCLTLPALDYPSASYKLSVALAEDDKVKTEKDLIFWRKSDRSAPAGVTLWVPEFLVEGVPGQKSVKVTVGSGVSDRWIPYVLSGDRKVLRTDWLHIDKDNQEVEVEVPEKGKSYRLDFSYMSLLKTESAISYVEAPEWDDNLKVETESFRDKVSSGDNEHWTFRFFRKSGKVSDIPAIAVMTDAALNAITPFNWNFYPPRLGNTTFYSYRNAFVHTRYMHNNLRTYRYRPTSALILPDVNDYGMDWGLNVDYYTDGEVIYYNNVVDEVKLSSVQTTARSMNSMKLSAAAGGPQPMYAEAESAMDMAVADEAEEEAGDEVYVTGSVSHPDEEFRGTEHPVAFFKPFLTSDKDGVVAVDFTVPNFNTTWAFQIIGYDSSLQTAKSELKTVASKPVMVSTHAPRFVRTGDDIVLTATVFNNSGEACVANARIELVDLLSGKTINAQDFSSEEIATAGSRVVSMRWTVPSDVSNVGFRAYAESGSHRDGEQALLPVLPASTPVVESTSFWVAPGKDKIEVKLPKFGEGDRITLKYCDNPVWYCLASLPDIVKPESTSVTAKMKALFGNVTAYNLISSNEGLRKGLETLLSDKDSRFAALKSNLEKDGNLKIVDLNNTPWVNNAESETLRMSRLSSLLDEAEAENAIQDILSEVRSLQTQEGGWSWCPDMEPSAYISRNVLSHFAMMDRTDALRHIPEATDMIKAALRYVDSETVSDFRKFHSKDRSLAYLLDWLYVRSSFRKQYFLGNSSANEMNSIAERAHKDIAAEWKNLAIGEKAKAAVVLWRAGNKKTASEILESLRQYASSDPGKGVWFDNLNSGWDSYSSLRTTTLVLEAFAEIEPADKMVDGIRQWLILGRQYQDWGKDTYTVETVNAILTSGSDWTEPAKSVMPRISIKGKEIALPSSAKLTGALTVDLEAKEASKKTLKIQRSAAAPAWGGVIAQFTAPILDVKPAEVPSLSIRKSIVALVDNGNGALTPKEGITLKKGMTVRVTLYIDNDRDMDYVAVTDERSACLEPIDQLSGRSASDGVSYYREVRDAATNLFFGWLPKGHHVVSYDCTISQDGEFSCGIATAQSQYSPESVAHSAGAILKVND